MADSIKIGTKWPRDFTWHRTINRKLFSFEAHRYKLDNGVWYEYIHVYKHVKAAPGSTRYARVLVHRLFRSVTHEDLMRKLSDGL